LSRFSSCVPLNILPRLSCIIFAPNLTEPAGTIIFRKGDGCNLRMSTLFVDNVGEGGCINLILPARITMKSHNISVLFSSPFATVVHGARV